MRMNCVLKDNVSSIIIQEYLRIIATVDLNSFCLLIECNMINSLTSTPLFVHKPENDIPKMKCLPLMNLFNCSSDAGLV